MKNSIQQILKLLICLPLLTGCSIKINETFDYQRFMNPEDIQYDIKQLKNYLESRHFDINWEGKKEEIFTSLDKVATIDSPISIDSFEERLAKIINHIDDGHSRVIHQKKKIQDHQNPFSVSSISDSVLYLRIGNFMEGDLLSDVLEEFSHQYRKKKPKNVIVDIQNNRGGEIGNVVMALSYFLPSKSKIYEKVKFKHSTGLRKYFSKLKEYFSGHKINKHTSNRKINGSPRVYVWINDRIASGSMLFSYHMQRNGATIIGQQPKGLFNTFGNATGYKLPKSKIVFTLSRLRLFLSNKVPDRMEDMIRPDFPLEAKSNIHNVLHIINNPLREDKSRD